MESFKEFNIDDIVLDIPKSDEEDDVKEYLDKVASYKFCSETVEIELSAAIQKGLVSFKELNSGKKYDESIIENLKKAVSDGKEAVKELALINQKYVVSIARKNLNRGLTATCLIENGNKGLIKAAKDFDYTRGMRFSTSANWYITRAIEKAVSLLNK